MGKQFFQHVVPSVLRPLRTLWNEIIGFLFMSLALLSVRPGWRAYREFDGDVSSLFELLITWLFGLMMLWFGISSFRRARRISRS